MRRSGAGLLLTLALTLQVGAMAGRAQAAPMQQGCTPAGYSHNNVGCAVVPRTGTFSVQVPGTTERLSSQGSAATAGTQLTVVKLPPPVPKKGGFGMRVRATGRFNPLHVSTGKLFRFDSGKNRLVVAKTVKISGVYQVTP